MLSRETLDKYRRMTTGERFMMTLKMTEEATPLLAQGPPELVARRFELIQRENDLRNENILRALARLSHEQ